MQANCTELRYWDVSINPRGLAIHAVQQEVFHGTVIRQS